MNKAAFEPCYGRESSVECFLFLFFSDRSSESDASPAPAVIAAPASAATLEGALGDDDTFLPVSSGDSWDRSRPLSSAEN